MKAKRLILACSLIVLFLALGCAPAQPSPAKVSATPGKYPKITIVGSTLGGIAATAAAVMATVLHKYYPEIEWSSSSGSSGTNVIFLTDGVLQLAITSSSNYPEAYGEGKEAASKVRTVVLAAPQLEYMWLVPQDKPWKSIADIPAGTTISPGATGTSTPVCADIYFQLAGRKKTDFNLQLLGKQAAADAWRAGKIDALLASIQVPAPFLVDMMSSPRKPKPLGLTPEQAKAGADIFKRQGWTVIEESKLAENLPGFFDYEVIAPKTTFPLAAREDFPDEITYKIAKVFDGHYDEMVKIYAGMKHMTPQYNIRYAVSPYLLHSGVAKYYREKGYLK